MTIDPDMTAAELALGLLEGEERAAALRRILAEPAFAREVEEWRGRLSGLFEDYPEIPAPDVERILDRPDASVRSRQRGGPIAAAIVAGIAAVLVLFVALRPQPALPPPPSPHRLMVASLLLTDKSASVATLVDTTTGEIRAPQTALVPSHKSAELWMIGGDGVPQAIGVLAASGPSRLQLPPDQRAKLTAGMTLAISIEPLGGSPTGKPTGPVIASGPLLVS